METCIHEMHAYIPTYIHTYMHIHTQGHTDIMHADIHTCVHAYRPTYAIHRMDACLRTAGQPDRKADRRTNKHRRANRCVHT